MLKVIEDPDMKKEYIELPTDSFEAVHIGEEYEYFKNDTFEV